MPKVSLLLLKECMFTVCSGLEWLCVQFAQVRLVQYNLLLQNNKRPIKKLLKYMLDVAMGMHYIAGKRLVHRVSRL